MSGAAAARGKHVAYSEYKSSGAGWLGEVQRAIDKPFSQDLMAEFPSIKVFSKTNLQLIRQWYCFWSSDTAIAQQPVAQLLQIPWGHNQHIPHVPDVWIDANMKDAQDQQVSIVGYKIPFNRHFYQYQPPRGLVAIDAGLDAVSAEIMNLPQEVHL